MYDIYDDLENNRVHAALLDSYSTASESKLFSKDWILVIEIIPVRYESANGLVLTGDATRLARCFRRYVRSETDSIHRIIQKNVGSIEVRVIRTRNNFGLKKFFSYFIFNSSVIHSLALM